MAYVRRAVGVSATLLLCSFLQTAPAAADPTTPSLEVWTGVNATSHAWSLYSGATYAPFGPIAAEGWRARIAGGYGEYRARRANDTGGAITFIDLLAGYHLSSEALTIKTFAGATVDLDEPENAVGDSATGWKVALEGWLNITAQSWAALDLSYGSAHDTSSGRLRLGYRIWPELSLGLEAGGFRNAESEESRGGAFARYEWAGGEISLSAGVSGDIAEPTNPYGSLVWLTRY